MKAPAPWLRVELTANMICIQSLPPAFTCLLKNTWFKAFLLRTSQRACEQSNMLKPGDSAIKLRPGVAKMQDTVQKLYGNGGFQAPVLFCVLTGPQSLQRPCWTPWGMLSSKPQHGALLQLPYEMGWGLTKALSQCELV